MQNNSQHRLDVSFRRTPYADTFRYTQSFKTQQIRFQDIFSYLDHILYSHTCFEWVFYIRDFNNEQFDLFYLPNYPPPANIKITESLYANIVFTINLDAIPAAYDLKYIKMK